MEPRAPCGYYPILSAGRPVLVRVRVYAQAPLRHLYVKRSPQFGGGPGGTPGGLVTSLRSRPCGHVPSSLPQPPPSAADLAGEPCGRRAMRPRFGPARIGPRIEKERKRRQPEVGNNRHDEKERQ